MAAFKHGVATRDSGGSPAFAKGNPIARLREELKKQDPTAVLKSSQQLLLNANLYRVSYNESRKLKLPHDYQYDNGKPNQVVVPGVLWGDLAASDEKLSLRQQFATWLTSSENPRFAKTLANRLWKKVMGVGLIEPVDDLRDDSPCENPQLLEFLTKELIRLNFNQKEFLRTLYFTKTYQRDSSDFDPSKAEFYHYPGPTLRRLTAEQVWDSILTLAIYNPYPFELPDTKSFGPVADLDLAKVSLADLNSRAETFDATVGPLARNKAMNTAASRRTGEYTQSELSHRRSIQTANGVSKTVRSKVQTRLR